MRHMTSAVLENPDACARAFHCVRRIWHRLSCAAPDTRQSLRGTAGYYSYRYPSNLAPGVYDIHSPRLPSCAEMETLLHRVLQVLRPEQIWVNPDCGLKTRRWEEVTPTLRQMVEAVRCSFHGKRFLSAPPYVS